jgi:hypothetical protein
LKKNIRYGLIALAVPYLAIVLLISSRNYRACETYAEMMNGGIQIFQGRTLNIRLCGLLNHGPINMAYSDEVRLQVFSMEGKLLAERFFEPLRDLPYGLQLEYGDDYLIYNDGEGRDSETKMAMPPTKLDWIRARLARIWPF